MYPSFLVFRAIAKITETVQGAKKKSNIGEKKNFLNNFIAPRKYQEYFCPVVETYINDFFVQYETCAM